MMGMWSRKVNFGKTNNLVVMIQPTFWLENQPRVKDMQLQFWWMHSSWNSCAVWVQGCFKIMWHFLWMRRENFENIFFWDFQACNVIEPSFRGQNDLGEKILKIEVLRNLKGLKIFLAFFLSIFQRKLRIWWPKKKKKLDGKFLPMRNFFWV